MRHHRTLAVAVAAALGSSLLTTSGPAGAGPRAASTAVVSYGGNHFAITLGTPPPSRPHAKSAEGFALVLAHTDRGGRPASSYLTAITDLDRFETYWISDSDGTAEIRVPSGNYTMASWIEDSSGTTMLHRPWLVVAADLALELDARRAGPVELTIPDRSVAPWGIAANGSLRWGDTEFMAGVVGESAGRVFLGHLGPRPVAGGWAWLHAMWANPGHSLVYDLAWRQEGAFYDGFTRRIGARELATIHETYGASGPELGLASRLPQLAGRTLPPLPLMRLPAERTYVVNTELPWTVEFGTYQPDLLSYTVDGPTRYQPGRTYHERFNAAVAGPALPPHDVEQLWISRTGDDFFVHPPMFGDSEGRAGFGADDRVRMALYRDGALIGEQEGRIGFFTVPAEDGRYRLDASASRGSPFRLSTDVRVSWGFKSSHVDGVRRLPVTAIGFRPRHPARAGEAMAVPLTVMRQQRSDAQPLKDLSIDVSYDDGASWRGVPVLNLPGQRFALITHPASPGYVSLRARAEDAGGNTVEQTIIRAYELLSQ